MDWSLRFVAAQIVHGTFVVLLVGVLSLVSADDTVVINPSVEWGEWEGWGCSLAWWASAFGDNDDLADLLFTDKFVNFNGALLPGLQMNIVRYAAGASSEVPASNGESMSRGPNLSRRKQIHGYWLTWDSDDPASSSWDWNVDALQRTMMGKAKDRNANHFELFSNSPMWWMLYNHNPAGGKRHHPEFCGKWSRPTSCVEGNLQSWNVRNHAVYLATIVKFARDYWGIDFASVAPFNEPSGGWWHEDGNQEGCNMLVDTQQQVISGLWEELRVRGLTSVDIAASDESSYDEAHRIFNEYDTGSKSHVGQVNVHGYQYEGGRRDLFHNLVHQERR